MPLILQYIFCCVLPFPGTLFTLLLDLWFIFLASLKCRLHEGHSPFLSPHIRSSLLCHYHRTHWPLVKGDRHKVLPIHPIRPGSQIEAQLLFLLILIFG